MFFRKIWEAFKASAERVHQERMEKGCEFCGQKPVCEVCYRCGDWDCNAGCIFCVRRRGSQPAG